MTNVTPDITRASSVAVYAGGTGSGKGWAVAVAAAPKSIAPASAPAPIIPFPRDARDGLRATWLAPSSGDQVAVTGDGWRQKHAKQNGPRLFLQNSGNLRFDVDREGFRNADQAHLSHRDARGGIRRSGVHSCRRTTRCGRLC